MSKAGQGSAAAAQNIDRGLQQKVRKTTMRSRMVSLAGLMPTSRRRADVRLPTAIQNTSMQSGRLQGSTLADYRTPPCGRANIDLTASQGCGWLRWSVRRRQIRCSLIRNCFRR